MAENQNENDKTLDAEAQLAEALKTMVPKTELEKAKEDYNRLYKKILSGEFTGKEEPEKDTTKELEDNFKVAMKEMAGHEVHSACQHAKDLLAIDDFFVAKGQRSIFEASEGDRDLNGARDEALKTRQLLEYALEQSNGDDNLFVASIANVLRDK